MHVSESTKLYSNKLGDESSIACYYCKALWRLNRRLTMPKSPKRHWKSVRSHCLVRDGVKLSSPGPLTMTLNKSLLQNSQGQWSNHFILYTALHCSAHSDWVQHWSDMLWYGQPATYCTLWHLTPTRHLTEGSYFIDTVLTMSASTKLSHALPALWRPRFGLQRR